MKNHINSIVLICAGCMLMFTSSYSQRLELNNTCYSRLTTPAEYMGGTDSLSAFLIRSISYPDSCRIAGIGGEVIITFAVDPEGAVTDVNIKQTSGTKALDDEAIRVIKGTSGNWLPAYDNNHKVRAKFLIPIRFAPDKNTVKENKSANKDERNNDTINYKLESKEPTYKKGYAALLKFIDENIKYPDDIENMGVTHGTYATTIDSTGNIINVKTLKTCGNTLLDKEAMRVISLTSGEWKPGYYLDKTGKKVKTTTGLIPVRFRITRVTNDGSDNY